MIFEEGNKGVLRSITMPEEDLGLCQDPCPPEDPCEACAEYWDRMRKEGFWVDARGWTCKGIREMCK